jgi:hypothetical protein
MVMLTNEEHHQAYRVLSGSGAQLKLIHTSGLLIYGGDVPLLFIVDVGKSITLSFEHPKPTLFNILDEVTSRV